jgi:peroxiredoxin
MDDVRGQAAFHAAQKLDFALLSDPDGSVAGKYGVLARNGRYPQRKTFLLDADGVVRHIDEKVDVTQHGVALVAWLRTQKAK